MYGFTLFWWSLSFNPLTSIRIPQSSLGTFGIGGNLV